MVRRQNKIFLFAFTLLIYVRRWGSLLPSALFWPSPSSHLTPPQASAKSLPWALPPWLGRASSSLPRRRPMRVRDRNTAVEDGEITLQTANPLFWYQLGSSIFFPATPRTTPALASGRQAGERMAGAKSSKTKSRRVTTNQSGFFHAAVECSELK